MSRMPKDGFTTLTALHDQVGPIEPTSDEDRHKAAINTAECALAQGWTRGELLDVLGALGIGGEA